MTADQDTRDFTVLDLVAQGIATGAGVGLLPKAPGTLGSLEGVLLFLGFVAFHKSNPNRFSTGPVEQLVVLNLLVIAAGIWAASRVCRQTGLNDPQKVVVDEISGQLISLTPLAASPSIAGVLLGFALFRLLDIYKPWPISRVERLHGGFGVMADDVVAGLLSALVVFVVHRTGLL